MRTHFLVAVLYCAITAASVGELAINSTENSYEIAIDGNHFASYRFNDAAVRRPYICNVTAPDGTPITRPYPPSQGEDHSTMHPGIWLAFGDINGHDFWRNKAWIKHDGVIEEPRLNSERAGAFTVRNRYETESGDVLLTEECRLEFRLEEDAVVVYWRSEFRPNVSRITFGDQEEMGLGFRLASNLTVDSGNGSIVNDRGFRNGDAVWGKTAAWCDYSGEADGATYGIAVVPSPDNFRASWMHARDYGLLVANPFGRKAMTGGPASTVAVTARESLTLEFHLVVHYGESIPIGYIETLAVGRPRD